MICKDGGLQLQSFFFLAEKDLPDQTLVRAGDQSQAGSLPRGTAGYRGIYCHVGPSEQLTMPSKILERL